MKQLKNKKHIIAGLAAVFISLLVLLLVYTIVDERHPEKIQSKKEYLGDIEIPAKKWLNGHLGVFFRFKQLGNINWLIIPLLIWFLTTKKIKKPERWQWALLFVWGLTVIFIGIKGYYNFRYQLTLVPITSAMVLFLSWKFLEDKSKPLKILGFSFITLACLFNIYHYSDLYKTYWNLRVSVKTPHFPYQLMDYLKSRQDLDKKSKVLTVNQPIFYYHLHKKGVDYISPNAIKVWVEFKKRTGSVGTRHKLYQMLRKRHGVRYALLSAVHLRFQRSTMLGEFLHCESKLVLRDQGWLLYRLRDKPLEKTIKSPAYKQVNVWNDDESKDAAASKLSFQKISPFLLRFSNQGVFKFDVGKHKGKKVIIVRNTRVKKNVKKRIHFGYEFNRKGLKIGNHEYEGKYVTFIVRAAISPSLLNRDNYIAVVDYNKDSSHKAEKTFFTSHHWRTYIVSKQVRPGNTRLLLMFRFCPQTRQDRFKIKDVKVVISEKPL
jgi:membrane protein implicated in regulation of membrane protease activity